MEENKNKFDLRITIIVIVLGMLIFCICKICSMSEDIAELKNSVANYQGQINRLNHNIDSIYDNVDNLLKKQASLVSSVDYTLGELDTEALTAPLTLNIVPKTLTADTRLSVRIGDTSTDLTRDGNVFTAIIPVGLFLGDEQYPILSIICGDEIKTEKLDCVFISNFHYDYLPSVYAHISPFYDYSQGKLKIESELYISVNSEGPTKLTKMELITELNGKEIERQDITSYLREDYHIAYNKTYSANEGDELVIYVLAEDSLGFIHKTRALYWMQKDGTVHEETVSDKGGEIYDKSGNLLK